MQFKQILALVVVVVAVLVSFAGAEQVLNSEVCKMYKKSFACGMCCNGKSFNSWEFNEGEQNPCVCKDRYLKFN